MNIPFEMPFNHAELDEALGAAEQGNAGPLRALCQKEVDRFEAHMKSHPDYQDGLVQIERFAVEGYLYQKIRGHIDATSPTNHLPKERQDGTA